MAAERSKTFQALVVVTTVAILSVYGWFLKWSIATGNWHWAFPLGIAMTAGGYFLVTDKAERMQGNADVMESLRQYKRAMQRWKRAFTSLLRR